MSSGLHWEGSFDREGWVGTDLLVVRGAMGQII